MLINTGLSIKLPKGTYGQIAPRSSLALKGIDIGGGIIDPDYSGEIRIILINNSSETFHITPDERIAQLVCIKYEPGELKEHKKDEKFQISNTSRGRNGFGSTGV